MGLPAQLHRLSAPRRLASPTAPTVSPTAPSVSSAVPAAFGDDGDGAGSTDYSACDSATDNIECKICEDLQVKGAAVFCPEIATMDIDCHKTWEDGCTPFGILPPTGYDKSDTYKTICGLVSDCGYQETTADMMQQVGVHSRVGAN